MFGCIGCKKLYHNRWMVVKDKLGHRSTVVNTASKGGDSMPAEKEIKIIQQAVLYELRRLI